MLGLARGSNPDCRGGQCLGLRGCRGGMEWYEYIITALVTAAVTAVVELYSMRGSDTVTCPFSAMAVLVPLTWLFRSVI